MPEMDQVIQNQMCALGKHTVNPEPTHFSMHLSVLCMYHETLFSRR